MKYVDCFVLWLILTFLFLFQIFSSLVPPKVIPFTFGEDAFLTGQSVSVQCVVSEGDLPVRQRWSINGQYVSLSLHDVTISRINRRMSVLAIESVSGGHAGNYSCEASNDAGVSRHSTELIINGL